MHTTRSYLRQPTQKDQHDSPNVERGILLNPVSNAEILPVSRETLQPILVVPSNTTRPKGHDIEHWQACADNEAEDDDLGVVARLLRGCIDSLSHLLHSIDLFPIQKQLRRSLVLLKLWADGHGAWDGQLDNVLERSKNLRHVTLSILNPLLKSLSNGMPNSSTMSDKLLMLRQASTNTLHLLQMTPSLYICGRLPRNYTVRPSGY
jgi:hypothetical protein